MSLLLLDIVMCLGSHDPCNAWLQLAALGCRSPSPLGPVFPNPSTVKEEGVMVLNGRGNFFLGRMGYWVG